MLTPEQKAERIHSIGSSDSAAACGICEYRTPLELFLEKTGKSVPVNLDNDIKIRLGNVFEEGVAKLFAEETGYQVERYLDKDGQGMKFVDPEHSFLTARPDFKVSKDSQHVGTVECKTVQEHIFEQWDGKLPLRYFHQVQHQHMVMGTERAWVPVMIFSRFEGIKDFVIFPCDRDQEYITMMRKMLVDFWNAHILAGVPPAPSNDTDIPKYYAQEDPGKVVFVGDEITLMHKRMKEIRSIVNPLEKEYEALKVNVQSIMGDAESLQKEDGTLLFTWKQDKQAMFDPKAFQCDHPDLYNEYRKNVIRRFLAK